MISRRRARWLSAMATAWMLTTVIAVAQMEIEIPKEGAVSTLRNQAVIGHAPANLPIRIEVNGVAADSGTVRPDGVFEFLGVPTPEGPVTYRIVATMRNGKTFTATRSMHVLGAPDSVILHLPEGAVPADGTTMTVVTGTVVDRWGASIPDAYMVTVAADSFDLIAMDADPSNPGVQVPLESGELQFALRSGTNAGPGTISLEVNGVTARYPLYLTTPRQPFMLTGSISGTGSFLRTTGAIGDISNPGPLRDGFNRQGRIAVIGRGTLLDQYLVTLSIDSDRRIKDRLYRDLDPNVLYAVYGDNSAVTYEAQSASPVFAKIERNQSYLMYGDFNTGLTGREFGVYNRSFTGGKLHLQNAWSHLDLFGTVTNRKVVQEEIRGNGTSGFYFLQNSNIVTGSEKIRIEVRDYLRTDLLLSSQDRSRVSDYEIDYTQGTIYFKQPVPSLDERGNPVYIVVSSEAITATPNNAVVGGAGEITLLDVMTLGVTAVVEERSPTSYTLLGGNGGLKLGPLGAVRGEIARTSDVEQTGYAWKVEGELSPFWKPFTVRPYYRRVDGAFNNTMQRGANQDAGTTKYGVSADLQAFDGMKLSGELYHQIQTGAGKETDLQSISCAIRQKLWNGGQVTLKGEDIRYQGPSSDPGGARLQTHSTYMNGHVDVTVLKGLVASVEGDYEIRKTVESVRPSSIGAGLDYEIVPELALFANQKLLEGGGQISSVGVRSRVSDHTTVEGRYEIGNLIGGRRSAASIGLKNTWKLTDDLTTNILYEKTKNLTRQLVGTVTPDHDALSLSFEYLPVFPLKISLKGEYGAADNVTRLGMVYGVLYRPVDNVSLIAKGSYYLDRGQEEAPASRRGLYTFGLAYRPATVNWLNLIGQVDVRAQENGVVQPAARYHSVVTSLHASLRPTDASEIGVRYALKSARDQADGLGIRTVTDLIQVRPQYDITSFLNIAGEARLLRQREIGDMKLGYSAEVGVVVIANTMIVAGYNFQGYKEQELVDYTYTARGPYITIRAKFTEQLFGIGN